MYGLKKEISQACPAKRGHTPRKRSREGEIPSPTQKWTSWSKLWGMVKDREAWHATVHAVTKSRIWLSDWTATTTKKAGDPTQEIVKVFLREVAKSGSGWQVCSRWKGLLARMGQRQEERAVSRDARGHCPRLNYMQHVWVKLAQSFLHLAWLPSMPCSLGQQRHLS